MVRSFSAGLPLPIELIAEEADIATKRAVFACRFSWEDATSAAVQLGSRVIEDQASLPPAERVEEMLNMVDLLIAQKDWRKAQPLAYLAADLVAKEDFDGSDELRARVSACLGTQEIGSPDAIAHARRAIAFVRSAAEKDPARYRMTLAGLLANYSWLIHETEGPKAALAISDEAIKTTNAHFEQTAVPRVDEMIARAAAFQNHGVNLKDAGHPREALEFLEEPVEIWDKLYDVNWPHSTRSLSSALGALADAAKECGGLDIAIELAEWDIDIWQDMVEQRKDPNAVSELIRRLSSLAVTQLKASQPEAALQVIEKALRLDVSAADDRRSDDATTSVILRANRCAAYDMVGQFETAVDAGYEAVEYADQVIRVEGRAPDSLMSLCLFGLGNSLRSARRIAEATVAYQACVQIGESISELYGRESQGDAVLDGARRALAELLQRDED